MKAVILAAGIGMRLGGGAGAPPKCLLEFGGKSLLLRHLRILESVGVSRVAIGVGYEAGMVETELARYEGAMDVVTVFNPDYRQGNIVTLWRLRGELEDGGPVLLMDADVLYDHRIMAQLVSSPSPNCFLMDREFEPGDEPVKLCLREGRVVEFGKQVDDALEFDLQGESVGFFKLSPDIAGQLTVIAERFMAEGRTEAFYEEALRILALDAGGTRFGVEDITGLPWIEIDFPRDIETARQTVLPSLAAPEAA